MAVANLLQSNLFDRGSHFGVVWPSRFANTLFPTSYNLRDMMPAKVRVDVRNGARLF